MSNNPEYNYYKEWLEYMDRYEKAKKDNPMLDYYDLIDFSDMKKRGIEPNFVIYQEDDCQ